MGSQLSLFEVHDYAVVQPCGDMPTSAALAPCPGLAGFHQPAFRDVLPARYVKGLDVAPRRVTPFASALVICGTGQDVECDEMVWGYTGADGALGPTTLRRGWWPGRSIAQHQRRCVVVADSFALLPEDETLVASVTPKNDAIFYLAGLCQMTAAGPAFSLIERRAAGALKRAGPTIPLLVEEEAVGDWLNNPLSTLSPHFGLAHPGHIISFNARLAI